MADYASRFIAPASSCLLALLFLSLSCGAAETIRVGEDTLHLEWRSDFSIEERQKLQHWLTKAAHTARQLYGRLPLDRSRVVVYRSERRRKSNSPVPWAEPIRGGRQGIAFYVDPTRSLESFIADWTAPHEFSHLFIPYPGQSDLWLSEGFASYYQNILMAREGLLTPSEAWEKLYEGFQRAERNGRDHLTLRQLSSRRRSGGMMRIYWSGALLFLQADMMLRRQSDGRQTLDQVIETFNRCCRSQRESWQGPDLMASFDHIAGSSLFSDLYRQYAASTAIPDYLSLFSELGLRIEEGHVNLAGQSSPARQLMEGSKRSPTEKAREKRAFWAWPGLMKLNPSLDPRWQSHRPR